MEEPWFDPQTFGAWYGGLVGGLGGAVSGVVLGSIPYPARTAGQRALVWGVVLAAAVVGIGSLAAGAIAWWSGQPPTIAWPLALVGVPFTLCAAVIGSRRLRRDQPPGTGTDAEPGAAADGGA